jgi:multicomponent Na+:H+ antiporter subunit C
MTTVIAFIVFVTVTAGIYLALSRDIFRCVIGLAILGAAANLVLYAAGRLGATNPAVVPLGNEVLVDAANPLPQALVLTAIVIGFALVCYSLVLLLRLMHSARTDDALALRHAEPHADDPVKPPASDPACDVTWPPEGRT